jgi:hypothetical protein
LCAVDFREPGPPHQQHAGVPLLAAENLCRTYTTGDARVEAVAGVSWRVQSVENIVERMTRSLLLTLVGVLLSVGVACRKAPTEAGDPAIANPPGPMTSADLEFCREETNRYRQQQGRPAVALSESLSERARAAAEYDHATGRAHDYFLSHPLGGAENEVLRWSGSNVRQTMTAAIAGFSSEGPSGGHWQNLMGPYREVGCGVATGGGQITFVQNLR